MKINYKLFLSFILLLFLFFAEFSLAEENVCGEVPLYLGRYAAPEILFIVDLSGSMAYGLRPDWSPVYNPTETYSGFFVDHGFKDYVFNRVFYSSYGYFEIYPCATEVSGLDDDFLTDECYYNLWEIDDLDDRYIDDILLSYGIADWSYHWLYDGPPYAEKYDFYYNSPYLYEDDTVALGNYLDTMRIEIVSNVIRQIVQDASLAIGLGFFKQYFPEGKYYTKIYEGIEPYSTDHVSRLVEIMDEISHESFPCGNSDYQCYRVWVGGGTPFSPSIVAAKKYFQGLFTDENGQTYTPGLCAKKFAIFLTDGVGNIDSTVDNVISRTRDLINSGVTAIAVGFNLPPDEDAQLRAMAEVANEEADGENTFALHRDQDGDGKPDPFIARNPQELAETIRSIIYQIKQTVFKTGTGTARKTDVGDMIIWTNFDLTDWTGEVRTGNFAYNCANCHSPSDVRLLARWNFFKDEDGDGHLDLVNEDKDGDGRLDTVFEDKDNDGHLDVDEDINNNGILDDGEDVDGDGHLDVAEDVDGDGHLDVPEDIDGDGHLDVAEGIDWEALEEFLSDPEQIEEKMGSDALKNYSSSKISTIIQILKGELSDNEWWNMENGWSTSETLSCSVSSDRNIKYGPNMLDFSGAVSPLTSEEVAFIRGERGCGTSDPEFRTRSKPLGDIINSQPRVWNSLVWVAANDGMLHAFDINNGQEVFAYIPQSILSRYQDVNYFDVGYCHAFLFDGTPVIQELDGKTLLVVGLGRGGAEYLALDITNAPDTVVFKWSFTDTDLGETWNPAKFVQCSGDWKAILPSGYPVNDDDWSTKKAFLYLVDAFNGTQEVKVSLGTSGENMPSPPAAVDLNDDKNLDYLYVGDLQGNLWRLQGCSFSNLCQLLSLGSAHPITASPVVTVGNDKTWVFLGTGKYWDINDLSDTNSQYLIGFKDDPSSCSSPELTEISFTVSNDVLLPVDSNCSPKNGWKVTLRPGERVITPPLVIGGTVIFLTFLPTGDECTGGGETWIYALDYNKGCATNPRIDINDDAKIDNSDLVNGKVPIGRRIGGGVPNSEPTLMGPNFLRVITTDKEKGLIIKVKNVWIRPGSWTDVDVTIH